MSAIIRPRSTRFGQPTGPVEIDWSNPLAQNLRLAITGASSGPIELTTGTPLVVSGAGVSVGTGTPGYGGRVVDAGHWFYDHGKPFIFSNEPYACICIAETSIVGTTTRKRAFSVSGGDNAFWGVVDYYNNGVANIVTMITYSSNAVYQSPQTSAFSGYLANTPYVTGYSFNNLGSPNTFRTSCNGRNQVAPLPVSTSAAGSFTHAQRVRLGNGSNNAQALNGNTYLVLFFAEFASQAKLDALTANPWQLLRPIQHRIWFDVGRNAPILSGQQIGQSIRWSWV